MRRHEFLHVLPPIFPPVCFNENVSFKAATVGPLEQQWEELSWIRNGILFSSPLQIPIIMPSSPPYEFMLSRTPDQSGRILNSNGVGWREPLFFHTQTMLSALCPPLSPIETQLSVCAQRLTTLNMQVECWQMIDFLHILWWPEICCQSFCRHPKAVFAHVARFELGEQEEPPVSCTRTLTEARKWAAKVSFCKR